MSDETDYGKPGKASDVCASGRSAGTPATRPERYHWKSDWGDRVWGDEYESIWRERKEVRKQNKIDFENGKDTPAVRMMKKNNINVLNKNIYEKWEPTETVEVEWVERKGGGGLMPKRGSYDYGFVYNEVEEE